MGRLLTDVYVVTGVLHAVTPVHIGGAEADLVADMPLARDGRGRFYLPATSLAGPIRRWWQRRRFEEELVFGRTPTAADPVEGHASYVIVEDAPVAGNGAAETRDGVGIDRETGAAAEGIKYDREVLPVGTAFDFRMEIQIPDRGQLADFLQRLEARNRAAGRATAKLPELVVDEAQVSSNLGALIIALEKGRIRFGAAKTRGLGRLELKDTYVVKQEIGRREGLLKRLRHAAKPNLRDELVAGIADAPDEVEITIQWRPILPVMNKSDVEGVSVDALPLVTTVGGRLQPVITGASIKGVLRSHAERICRTLSGAVPSTTDDRSPRQQFLDDLNCDVDPAVTLVSALFGSRGLGVDDDKRYPADRDSETAIPGLGALSIDDCVVAEPISRDLWNQLLTVAPPGKDKEHKTVAVRELLREHLWKDYRAATHVAIDRWTGAASDGQLFSRLEPSTGGPAREFRLSLDPQRIARPLTENRRPHVEVDEAVFNGAALALLVVLLRELVRGRIPIGFGSTRGLGSIAVERITISAPPTAPQFAPGKIEIAFDPTKPVPPDAFAAFSELQTSWQAYWNAYPGRAVA